MRNDIFLLAALMSIAGSVYVAFRWARDRENKTVERTLADKQSMTTSGAQFVIPSANPTDPGFSNYSRRWDILEALDIADQPLAYGMVIPQ